MQLAPNFAARKRCQPQPTNSVHLAANMSTSHYTRRPYQGTQTVPANTKRRSVAYAAGLGALLIADLVALTQCGNLGESLTIAALALITIGTMWKGDLL